MFRPYAPRPYVPYVPEKCLAFISIKNPTTVPCWPSISSVSSLFVSVANQIRSDSDLEPRGMTTIIERYLL